MTRSGGRPGGLLVALAVATSALLLVLAGSQTWGGWLGLVSLVPWIAVVRARGAAACAATGMLLGTLAGVGGSFWVVGALSRFGSPPLAAIAGQLVTALLVVGVPYGLLGAALGISARKTACVRAAIAAGTVFIVDLARSHGLGVPWHLLGHTQLGVPGVAQLAVLGGVPLLSALLAAGNVAIADALHGRAGAPALVAAVAGAWLGAGVLGLRIGEAFHPVQEGPPVARLLVIQPNIPPGERWVSAVQPTNLGILLRQTKRALATRNTAPDVVVWPETSLTNPLDRDPELSAALQEAVDDLGVPLVVGVVESAPATEGPRYHNVALRLEPGHGELARVEKTRGVPVVESGTGLGMLRPLVGQPADRRRMAAGQEAGSPLSGPQRFAVAFCYEVVFADLVARRRDRGTLAILNLANDSWFESPMVSGQQIAFGAFRAIEQRLPLVRVAHGGVSAHVDPLGRIVSTLPFDSEGSMDVLMHEVHPIRPTERLALAALLVGGALAGLAVERIGGIGWRAWR